MSTNSTSACLDDQRTRSLHRGLAQYCRSLQQSSTLPEQHLRRSVWLVIGVGLERTTITGWAALQSATNARTNVTTHVCIVRNVLTTTQETVLITFHVCTLTLHVGMHLIDCKSHENGQKTEELKGHHLDR